MVHYEQKNIMCENGPLNKPVGAHGGFLRLTKKIFMIMIWIIDIQLYQPIHHQDISVIGGFQ